MFVFPRQARSAQVLIVTAALATTVAFPSFAATGIDKNKQLVDTAIDAYIYGYPLVTMEMTKRIMTNVASPEGTRAPLNQFVLMRTYPDASFTDVTAPNADTLYSTVWTDVTKEPMILSIPDMSGRYYLMPMLDGWTDVFQVPGKRTTGTKAQTYAITGPGWSGKLPPGVTQYKSPTGLVWILGRIYCTGTPDDYAKVHALQDKLSLVPLSSYGKKYTPAPGHVDSQIDMKTAVRDQVNGLSTTEYFKLLANLMKTNPPAKQDAPMVAKLAKLGIVPGKDIDTSKLTANSDALKDVPKVGFKKILGHFQNAGTKQNGWVYTKQTGIYGTGYLERALITAIGLGANRPQDAVYPTSETNFKGQGYSGKNNYVMHFDKGQTPPVNGFWSLTMYNAQMFFVANPLNRYTVSSRFPFKYSKDGSLDLYVQHNSPGKEKEANWLPAPADKFNLMLRMYWPKEQMLNGSYTIPAVKQTP